MVWKLSFSPPTTGAVRTTNVLYLVISARSLSVICPKTVRRSRTTTAFSLGWRIAEVSTGSKFSRNVRASVFSPFFPYVQHFYRSHKYYILVCPKKDPVPSPFRGILNHRRHINNATLPVTNVYTNENIFLVIDFAANRNFREISIRYTYFSGYSGKTRGKNRETPMKFTCTVIRKLRF